MDSLYTADITRTLPGQGHFLAETSVMVYDAVLRGGGRRLRGGQTRCAFFASMSTRPPWRSSRPRLTNGDSSRYHSSKLWRPRDSHHRRYMIHGTSHHLGLDVHDCAHARRREMYLEGKELEDPGWCSPSSRASISSPMTRQFRSLMARNWGADRGQHCGHPTTGGINLSAGIPRTAAEVEKPGLAR